MDSLLYGVIPLPIYSLLVFTRIRITGRDPSLVFRSYSFSGSEASRTTTTDFPVMTAFPYSIPFPKAAHTRNSSASATVSEFGVSG